MKEKENDFKRCTICGHSNLGNEERRKFYYDKATKDYHCDACAYAVQDAVIEYELRDPNSNFKWDNPVTPYWRKELKEYKDKTTKKVTLPGVTGVNEGPKVNWLEETEAFEKTLDTSEPIDIQEIDDLISFEKKDE